MKVASTVLRGLDLSNEVWLLDLQTGLVVVYHMIKKFQETPPLDRNGQIGARSLSSRKHAATLFLKWLGLLMRGGLSFASVREVLKNSVPAVQYPLATVGFIGRVAGSYYVEGEHTHIAMEGRRGRRQYGINFASMLLIAAYATIFVNHTLEFFFSTKETADELQINQGAGIATGLSFGVILSLQAVFLDAHHFEEAGDYIRGMSHKRFVDVLGSFFALLGALGHAAPGLAGASILFREIGVSKSLSLIVAGIIALVDFFPGLFVHGRYTVEAVRDASSMMNQR